MHIRRCFIFTCFVVWLFSSSIPAFCAEPPAFWVWKRSEALHPQERREIEALGAKLLWQIGELDLADGGAEGSGDTTLRWRWRESLPETGAIPVLRINVAGREPFRAEGLAKSLARFADSAGRLQIDCDCPDRLLADYARFLAELRQVVPHLSITALAAWSRHPAFGELQKAVECIDVMFYDLEPDPPGIGPSKPPKGLLEFEDFEKNLASWETCKTRWRAGLPNFSRVSVFDGNGRSLGHIRNWTWEEATFQPLLTCVASSAPGVVLMQAKAKLTLASTPINAGSFIAVRWVDQAALARALAIVKASRAAGPVFFRLPDSSDPSGWSVSHLKGLIAERKSETTLVLAKEGERFVLKNTSEFDLAPRLSDDKIRGYALEVDAPAQIWREAVAGEFWRVGAHADPEETPVPVPVPLATRLTFWFPTLRAGQTLKSGLIQLAPDADFSHIRYRIIPGDDVWRSLE